MRNLTIEKQSMERPHRVLEKKLHELEMQFTDLFFPPANSINPASDQENLSKEIEARVEFLKKLLSVEKDLQGKTPSHLVRLQERLDGLNAAFRDWMDGGDFVKKEMPGEFQACSCTRSCFSSEEEEEERVHDEEEQEEKNEGEKEKELEEEASGMAESECLELEIKENPRVLEVKGFKTEESSVLEVKNFDERKIDEDRKKLRGYYRTYFHLISRILVFVGAALAVSIGVTVMISEVFGGFQEDVFIVPT